LARTFDVAFHTWRTNVGPHIPLPLPLQVRLYVLQGHGLTPQDPNGKADPFLIVKLGSKSQGSTFVVARDLPAQFSTSFTHMRAHLLGRHVRPLGWDKHIPEELNPKFYSVYEFHVTFPGESLLTVRQRLHKEASLHPRYPCQA
jgi:hypothetical protein